MFCDDWWKIIIGENVKPIIPSHSMMCFEYRHRFLKKIHLMWKKRGRIKVFLVCSYGVLSRVAGCETAFNRVNRDLPAGPSCPAIALGEGWSKIPDFKAGPESRWVIRGTPLFFVLRLFLNFWDVARKSPASVFALWGRRGRGRPQVPRAVRNPCSPS